jgi:hypothetical protein
MAVAEKTLDRLQHLEFLYRQGYQSEIIDLSVEKILDLERTQAQRELAELQFRLEAYEHQYKMTSQEFIKRFERGELGDNAEFVEWSVFYDMWKTVHERLKVLEEE